MTVEHRTIICECDRCNLEEIHHQDKRRSWSDNYSWAEWKYPDGWEATRVPDRNNALLLCPRCLQKFKETGE